MANLARAVACLRIFGEDLVPDDVSALLGSEPTEGWMKGDELISSRAMRIAPIGLWRLEADETEPADFDVQVSAILGRLTSDLSAWAAVRTQHEVDLFCGWFMEHVNEGVSIEPGTMMALGARGIALTVDLYAGDSENSPR